MAAITHRWVALRVKPAGRPRPHARPLVATDAFGELSCDTICDYEALLEVDPDVILHQFGIPPYCGVAAVRETVAGHEVGAELSAIRNDRFYPSGNPVQGPPVNLFQLEMTAKQLYLEQFGAWPEYEAGAPYPDIPTDERLFDRERVAAIVRRDG